jgi:hypothetical protein
MEQGWRVVQQPLAAEFQVVEKSAGGKKSNLNENELIFHSQLLN